VPPMIAQSFEVQIKIRAIATIRLVILRLL
jgi:hypothetical protein